MHRPRYGSHSVVSRAVENAIVERPGTVQRSRCRRGGAHERPDVRVAAPCGEVRYRLKSDPLFTHCCHCLNCQRQTGSAFVINVLIEADRDRAARRRPGAVPLYLAAAEKKAEDLALPDLSGRGLQPVHEPEDPLRPRRDARRPIQALRPTFTSSRGPSSPGSRFRTRCRHSTSLRHEEAVAGRESRATRGDHGAPVDPGA